MHDNKGHAMRAVLALAVLLASNTAMANGAYWIPGDRLFHFLPQVIVYEILVVLVEWGLIRSVLGQSTRKALALSLTANVASYLAGIPLGFVLLQLRFFAGYALITVPQLAIGALILNWVVEAIVIALAGRLPMNRGYWARVLGVNALTWLLGFPFVASSHYGRSVPSHSRVSAIRSDMRQLSSAIEKYYEDHRVLPPSLPLRDFVKDATELEKAGGLHLTGLDPGRPGRAGLTTPVAYISSIPVPRDNPDLPDAPYAYYSNGERWILFSPGGDGRYDIVPARDFVTSIPQPSHALLLKAWDPTNGMASAGDIFRVR